MATYLAKKMVGNKIDSITAGECILCAFLCYDIGPIGIGGVPRITLPVINRREPRLIDSLN